MSEIEYETVLVKVDSVTYVSKQVPKAQPEPEPEAPQDPLADLLDGNTASIEAALASLTDGELAALLVLEAGGKTRKGVTAAIEAEQLARLEAAEQSAEADASEAE